MRLSARPNASRPPGYVQARTATINRIRGLLSEFGIVLPQKAEVVRREAGKHLEDLPGYANLVIGDLLSEVHHLDERIKQYDAHVRSMARDCTAAQPLMQLCGVGQTTATAIVAMVGNGAEFSSGRQFAAWLGLVPGLPQSVRLSDGVRTQRSQSWRRLYAHKLNFCFRELTQRARDVIAPYDLYCLALRRTEGCCVLVGCSLQRA